MHPLACLDGDLKSGAALGALILIMGLTPDEAVQQILLLISEKGFV